MENQIHVFATWKVKAGQTDKVLEILKTIQEQSIKEDGNVFYTIHQNNADKDILLLHECYANDKALEEHRNSGYFQELVLGTIVPLLEEREIILATKID